LYHGDEVIKAKANLNSMQYAKADKAHMKSGSFIKVKGVIQSGKQPRNLINITQFDLIES